MDTPPAHAVIPDLVCFSHLRWDFVYQRPQHLMSRFARVRRVSYIEEPVYEPTAHPHLRVTPRDSGVNVVVPVLPHGTDARESIAAQHQLLSAFIADHCGTAPTFWLQTPMALPVAPTELAGVVIYDCMDELGAFQGASPSLVFNEKQLLARADLVFTGGRALYEAKKSRHPRVHCFPSGIDRPHFAKARAHRHGSGCLSEFREMPSGVRVGFAGVIDERLDIDLLGAVADERPDFQFVMLGPVVKIDPDSLPQRANIHYLGIRGYEQLPDYMAEWDVAMMPFARNSATRYISPTKTPEYLAAGLPVVSTSIFDVVRQYGQPGLVAIADEPAAFADAIEAAVPTRDDLGRLRTVDAALAQSTWESVWERMAALERAQLGAAPAAVPVPSGNRARAQ